MTDREKLIDLLMQKGFGKEGATIAANHLIANGVTVQKYGRWIRRPDERICPVCGYRYAHFGGKDYNYCPHCGTKMED